jgi:hypothetical protein
MIKSFAAASLFLALLRHARAGRAMFIVRGTPEVAGT